MPLPVGHSLAGYSIYESQSLGFFDKKWKTVLFFMVLANLPDIDFLPGFLVGNPNLYHHGIVHSLGATLLVALAGACYFARKNGKFWAYFGIIGGVYYSHLLLDFFSWDVREPLGVMLFWPISGKYFMSPWPLFAPVDKSSDSTTFFQSLLTWHNLGVAARELLIMAPVALIPVAFKKLKLRMKKRLPKLQKLPQPEYLLQRSRLQVQPVQQPQNVNLYSE